MIQCQAFDDQQSIIETKNFLDELPYRLKIKTVMHIYREHYELIPYLKRQNETFLSWICPQMKQNFLPREEYVYQESDQIEEIYFVVKGSAGYVIPFRGNIVYVYIVSGDCFGEIDIFNSAL